MVHTAVIGARGYLGRELVRLLLSHPQVDSITPVTSGTPGEPYGASVPSFAHERDLVMRSADDKRVRDADVLFLATDNDEAKRQVAANPDAKLVIDLSRAHRHEALEAHLGHGASKWTYGMSEFVAVPKGATRIANPGCYPTATMVAAGAALATGLAQPGVLISDGKSGVSGAGATARADLHYPEMHDAVRAYKVLGHDHGAEIRLAAGVVEQARGRTPSGSNGTHGDKPGAGASPRPVRFTPHLVPMNRGLLATVYLPTSASSQEAQAAYAKHYASQPFVRLVKEADTTHVRHSNFADVAVDVDPDSGLLVARCAIDNLVKGGSGAAVQNMNLALGLPATTGLTRSGGGP